jgi:hypothetical protein
MDFVVGGALPVMVVSTAEVTPLMEAQFRSKLRLGFWRDGLLMNFTAPTLGEGLRRLGVAPQRFEERKAAKTHPASIASTNPLRPPGLCGANQPGKTP